MPTREEMWSRVGEEVDVLIIGGGINGAGIARDASRRGLSVCVVEQKDLAYGTSSRSSKLVHGGLRYLEQLEFSLVFESVSERRILLDIAPHLVNPLGFLFPVYKGSRRGIHTINAGMWIYEGLSLFRTPKRHRLLKTADVKKEEPALRNDKLQGAPLYYDSGVKYDDTSAYYDRWYPGDEVLTTADKAYAVAGQMKVDIATHISVTRARALRRGIHKI